MQQIEIEFKNLLLEKEFNQLIKTFQITEQDFFLQENHYLDTADFSLKQLKCALRIRKKGNYFELTLKEPNEIGLLETNESITKEQTEAILNGNAELPHGEVYQRLMNLHIPIKDIKYFGSLKTWRAERKYFDGIIVFDKSEYFNKIDYELEYEVNDFNSGQIHFQQLLENNHIPIRKTPNKVIRFYLEKQKQQS